jgi:septum formation protein
VDRQFQAAERLGMRFHAGRGGNTLPKSEGSTIPDAMLETTDEFIADYLDSEGEAVLGCVGCYRIEGLGAQLFTRVDGDQFTVRGLPLFAVLDFLRVRGVLPA